MEALLRFNGYNKQKEKMIRHGQNRAVVEVGVQRKESRANYRLVAERVDEKSRVQKKQPFGPMPFICFSPADNDFFTKGPQDRRCFIDSALGVLKKKYCRDLSDYQRIVKQKNNLLKEGGTDGRLIDSFNQQLVKTAAAVIKEREAFLREIEPLAGKALVQLCGQAKRASLIYISKTDLNDIEESLWRQLREKQELEQIRGCCVVGPHRDDLSFIVDDFDVAEFGSQGEKKTACLALKMAQLKNLQQKGVKPLLILDDAFSELDPRRRQLLLEAIPSCEQTFITATDTAGIEVSGGIKRIELG